MYMTDFGKLALAKHKELRGKIAIALKDKLDTQDKLSTYYTPGVAAEIFNSIRDINVPMISHGASNINLSFLVHQTDADPAVQKLHAYFFREFDPAVFEPPA